MPRAPIDSGLIFELPSASDPAIRPDGSAVAFVQSRTDAESMRSDSRLMLVPFGGGDARQLTTGPRDRAPAWSPDGQTLAFLRTKDDGEAQVWLLPADGGEARHLTHLSLGVESLAWTPDGGALIVVADVDLSGDNGNDEVPTGKIVNNVYFQGDTVGWRGDRYAQLFRVDPTSGETRQLTRVDAMHAHPVVSPDGRWIAFSSDRSPRRQLRRPFGSELCVMPAAGGRVRRLTPGVQSASRPVWSPDGTQLVCAITELDERSQPYLNLINVASGERRRITDDSLTPQSGFYPLAGPPPMVWRGQRILLVADRAGSSGVYSITLGGRVSAVRERKEAIAGFSASPDGRRAAVVASESSAPAELFAQPVSESRARKLTNVGDAYLSAHEPGRVEWSSLRRAGVRIPYGIMFPPAFNPRRRYPLVLEIHGGPNGVFTTGFTALHQIIAGAGNLVLFVNPRGSSTYGSAFTHAVTEDWGGEDHLDLLAVLDAVVQRRYVDASRLGVHGYSYGGYMTSWLIGHVDRFKAAVVGAPVIDLQSMYGTTDIGVSWGDYQWGGRPDQRHDWYRERSPLTYAPNVKTPVLLLHGEADIRCPITQSEQYYTALKERGKTVEFVRFPGCSHLFLRNGHPALRREYYDRVLEWFRRWL